MLCLLNFSCISNPNQSQSYCFHTKVKYCFLLTVTSKTVNGEIQDPSKKTYDDGAKWMCTSPRYNIVHGKCLIISFGIGNDARFEYSMAVNFSCEVRRKTNEISVLLFLWNICRGGKIPIYM